MGLKKFQKNTAIKYLPIEDQTVQDLKL